MNLLQDIINYVRRIIKSPSNASITDNLIIDYINRFYIMDVDARMQLFDFKTTYRFQTSPGINQYNMPLYNTNDYPSQVEPGNQLISYYPVYQGFLGPAYINGIQVTFHTEKNGFMNLWPQYVQAFNNSFFGNGGATYTLTLPYFPALAGHVDITGIIAANSPIDPIVATSLNTNVPTTSTFPGIYITTQDQNNNTVVVSDSGQFLLASGVQGNQQLGLLTGDITPGWNATTNVVNYTNGQVQVTFANNVPDGVPINVQSYYIQQGIPRAILYYNSVITVLPPPDISYLVELEAYLSPAAFLSTSQSVPFAYMAEYIARGAARKMLADTGDVDQFAFYEPLFREQEQLVWKRSQRQFTSTRTQTIFSQNNLQTGQSNNYSGGY